MATVQIADIYNPFVFAGDIQESQIELNRFLGSGVIIPSSRLNELIANNANTGEITNFNPLTIDEPNYSSDDPGANSTPAKVDSVALKFRTAQQNKSWSVMDLADELALQKPAVAITGRIGQYWATNNELRVIQSSLGVLADNVANDAGDMVNDLSTDGAGAVTDAERISAEAVIDTQQTMGDHAAKLRVIAMHSAIYSRLKKQNLIDFIPNARGEVIIPTYLGLTVVFDDSLPAVMGVNRITYTCILYGIGAFGSGFRSPPNASELERVASAGNGGGQTILHSRRTDLIQPKGFDFLSATLNGGINANQSDLALATNWDRKWDRKNISMAFLKVND